MSHPSNPDGVIKADADTLARVRIILDSLNISLEAAMMALETADEAPNKLFGDRTVPQVVESWRASARLLHEVIDHLYYEGRHTIETIRQMIGQD